MKLTITSYGAIGDGSTLNTAAFQKACQAARENTDGHTTIIVPPGVYRSGTIELPSNTTLFLEAGAVIKASDNPDDFTPNPHIAPGRRDHFSLSFIAITNAQNVIIDGDGTIDGTGAAYWQPLCFDNKPWISHDSSFPVHYHVLRPKPRRPITVSFWKCTDITVRNVRITNAAAYTVWCQGCTMVRIQDLTIRNPYCGPNTDALDIDCSSNVIISGCDIAAGDDCIALKSDVARIGENLPCRNIVVTNCILSSTACGIRVAYEGDGPITDCSFSNLVIYDSKSAIDMLSLTPRLRPDITCGTVIERLQFTNISMRNVSRVFHIWSGTEDGVTSPYRAHISDLTFADINAEARCGCFIGSKDGEPISNLSMRNVRIHLDLHPYFNNVEPLPYPDLWCSDFIPDVLQLRRVLNVRLDNVELTRNAPAEQPLHGALLKWEQADDLRIDGQHMPASGLLN